MFDMLLFLIPIPLTEPTHLVIGFLSKWMMQYEGYLGNKNQDALHILLATKMSSMEEKNGRKRY